MAAPIYFFPAVQQQELVSPDRRLIASKLRDYGLEAIIGDLPARSFVAADLPTRGPGDKSGCFVTANTNGAVPVRAGYFPEFQTWRRVLHEPELWIGFDNEHPPKPQDLARSSRLSGWQVRLADGNEYVVPIIRSPNGNTGLPRDIYHDAEGVLRIEVKPAYDALWERAEQVWDALISKYLREGLGWDEVLGHCLCFLGLNYRYGRCEQCALRLIDTSESVWLGVLLAAVDMPFADMLAAHQKKTENPPRES